LYQTPTLFDVYRPTGLSYHLVVPFPERLYTHCLSERERSGFLPGSYRPGRVLEISPVRAKVDVAGVDADLSYTMTRKGTHEMSPELPGSSTTTTSGEVHQCSNGISMFNIDVRCNEGRYAFCCSVPMNCSDR